MATNPMQRKSRNAFLLGVVITLVIAAIIVFFLFRKIQNQQAEIETYQVTTASVYVLNQDVQSGQVLTADLFTLTSVPQSTIPADAVATNIASYLSSYFCDTEGRNIYYDSAGAFYYYFVDENNNGYLDSDETQSNLEKHRVYERVEERDTTGTYEYIEEGGNTYRVATSIIVGETYYYYSGADNSDFQAVVANNTSVVAKTNLYANTVITSSLITRADERTTDDLREMEYNVITLPIDLVSGEYIDIRLTLPNGQDFIVVSKKQVTIPMVNGEYLADTIKINLTEDEILLLSCAIVENYQIEGSNLYAVKYTEAGLQEEAELTYYPNAEVVNLINSDPNIVSHAINEIGRRSDIDSAIEAYGDEDNIAEGVQESITSTQEAREDYLQSLISSTTTTTTTQ